METIIDNLRLLITETLDLLETTGCFLEQPEAALFQIIYSRDDYIDNLKTIIENACFSRIHGVDDVTDRDINLFRATHTISVNLERVGDSMLNIGEALLFAIIGERIKINQFDALQETLEAGGFTGPMAEVVDSSSNCT